MSHDLRVSSLAALTRCNYILCHIIVILFSFSTLYVIGALQQIPDFITCTVTTTDKVISARCNNSDHNVTGFQMIVQNTNITDLTHVGKLMITRANDFSSLMSLQVEVSGEHLITIFSIRRGRGIINTYTPYQMRMTVDVSVTTSTLSSK